jgi:hypothetical protein
MPPPLNTAGSETKDDEGDAAGEGPLEWMSIDVGDDDSAGTGSAGTELHVVDAWPGESMATLVV